MPDPSRRLKIAIAQLPAKKRKIEINKAGKTLVRLASLQPDLPRGGKKPRCPCCGRVL